MAPMKPASSLEQTGDGGPLRRRVLRGAAGTFLLNVASSGLNLLIAILLAHALELSDYGIVVFVIATLTLLTIPGVFGLDRLLIREVAVDHLRNSLGRARSLVSGARRIVLGASLIIGAVTAAVTWLVSGGSASATATSMWIGLLALPFATWNRVQQGATLGLSRIVAAQIPEMLVRPLVFIGLVAILLLVLSSQLPPQVVIVMHVVSYAAAVAAGAVYLGRTMPRDHGMTDASAASMPSLRQAASFAALGGASVINNQAGIVLLGLMATTEQAGLYGAAARLALLVPFPLTAINAVLSPTAARLWHAGRIDELQRVVTLSARLTLLLSLPAAIAFIAFGAWFLDAAFPPAFVVAAPALAVLSLGQLVNASMGSVGVLLQMTGHERTAAGAVAAGAGITLVLSVALIPIAGIVGAALAAAASLTAWNVWLAIETRRRLGIDSTALGLHPRRPGNPEEPRPPVLTEPPAAPPDD